MSKSHEELGLTIVNILDVVEGVAKKSGKEFKTIDFVCEREGEEYNKLIAFGMFQGEGKTKVADFVNAFKVGDKVDVTFNIKTNDWTKDGVTKYFTSLDVWKLEKSTGGGETHVANGMPDSEFESGGDPGDQGDALPF